MRLSLLLFASVFAVAAPSFAGPVLDFTIAPSTVQGAPGDIVYLSATLQNAGDATLNINDLSVVFDSPADLYLSQDVNYFYSNVPGTLFAGDSWTADFMQITIDPGAPFGTYTGTASIIGGADEFATGTIGSQPFTVDVVAPEPGALGLMAAGLIALAVAARRRPLRN